MLVFLKSSLFVLCRSEPFIIIIMFNAIFITKLAITLGDFGNNCYHFTILQILQMVFSVIICSNGLASCHI